MITIAAIALLVLVGVTADGLRFGGRQISSVWETTVHPEVQAERKALANLQDAP